MSDQSNLSKTNENVKKQVKQFISLPPTADELYETHPTLFGLLFCLITKYQTYKYALVGVHEKVTMKALAINSGIGRNNLHRDLKTLQKLGYIKIFNTDPVLIQILELPSVVALKDIYAVLGTVRANKKDFNFFPKWENKFFETYSKQYREIDQGIIDTEPDDPFGYSATTS